MTEDEARDWLVRTFGSDAAARVSRFLEIVIDENRQQNLIAATTIPTIWARHALDSAQLLALAPTDWRVWLDVGTGGGFPGVIVALLRPDRDVILVEPRRKRADFLQRCAADLDLPHVRVEARKVEQVVAKADVISARAVAAPEILLRSAQHCATHATVWLLPRGRSGDANLEQKGRMFHVEHSLSDTSSNILVGRSSGR